MNEEEQSRPVEKSDWEIAGTFEDAGIRPIEESPDYLVPEEGEHDSSYVSNSEQSKKSKKSKKK